VQFLPGCNYSSKWNNTFRILQINGFR
jgi:hypothetical protein